MNNEIIILGLGIMLGGFMGSWFRHPITATILYGLIAVIVGMAL